MNFNIYMWMTVWVVTVIPFAVIMMLRIITPFDASCGKENNR
ncbi:MAG: hypothetical protein QM764_05030 [Chitinophagaceae bacterium]